MKDGTLDAASSEGVAGVVYGDHAEGGPCHFGVEMADLRAVEPPSRSGELPPYTEQEDGNVYAVETGEAGRLFRVFFALRGFA